MSHSLLHEEIRPIKQKVWMDNIHWIFKWLSETAFDFIFPPKAKKGTMNRCVKLIKASRKPEWWKERMRMRSKCKKSKDRQIFDWQNCAQNVTNCKEHTTYNTKMEQKRFKKTTQNIKIDTHISNKDFGMQWTDNVQRGQKWWT